MIGRPQRHAPDRIVLARSVTCNVASPAIIVCIEGRQVGSKRHARRTGERSHIDQQIRRLGVAQRERIGKNQPALGVGIADLDGDTLARPVDVARPKGAAGDRILVRLTFFGATAFQPLTARLVTEIGGDVNILAGAIEEIAGEPFGTLVVSYPSVPELIERASRFYAATGLSNEVLGYVA